MKDFSSSTPAHENTLPEPIVIVCPFPLFTIALRQSLSFIHLRNLEKEIEFITMNLGTINLPDLVQLHRRPTCHHEPE